MSEQQEPIIDAEEVTMEPISPPIKKKSRLKFHLSLILILGVATWGFWTFSAQGQQLKRQLFDKTWFSQPNHNVVESVAEPAFEQPTPKEKPITEKKQPEPTPIFEEEPTISMADTTAQAEVQPIKTEISPPPNLHLEDFADITSAMQNMQQQIASLQQTINQLYTQQLQQSQQQVRAQLFALLQRASSPQSSLDDMIIAWKSISFMPLLSQEKRDTANHAYDTLQNLQTNIKQTTNEIKDLMSTLAKQLQPKDLNEVAQTVGNLVDPYQQTDVFYSWLDWLKQQFIISKVDEHALNISDDPYAQLKQLITDLNRLQQIISQHQWDNINSLNSLLYRLEQRGFSVTFSRDSIQAFKQVEQTWQQEAQTWMAQL